MIESTKWHNRFMALAQHVSTWSRDPSSQIGAVAVAPDRNVLSMGYNGFPRGMSDDGRLDNREEKYELIVHAEMNAIYNASRHGISLEHATLYVYGLPVCHKCSLGIIQAGINQVVVKEEFLSNPRWFESWQRTQYNFTETGIIIDIL